jgi:hypothetical protein
MADLDEKEQKHVRTALHYLRHRTGAWLPVADALSFKPDTVEKVANARGRAVTASMALRVARLLGATVDDLLGGRFLPGACPRCGHMPDFADEPTTVEDAPRPALGGGLKVVK